MGLKRIFGPARYARWPRPFSLSVRQPMIIAEVELEYSPIPDGCPRRLDEVTIKGDGQVWRIHKSDVDPFPSDPHAHNPESGLKLDLSNGDLFLGSQYTKRSITKKALLDIRHKAEAKGVQLPALGV
jgi:hypothetical protein